MKLPRAVDGRSAVQVARLAAREAGKLARAGFGTAEDLGYKGWGDIVTETDLACEVVIAAVVEAAFPEHHMLSEETRSKTPLDGWVWVVDRIDGTTNFSQGLPFFCINIALCLDGVPVLGLTFDPIRREEFLAVAGRGVTVNGKHARVRPRSFADAMVIFDSGGGATEMLSIEAFKALVMEVMHPRLLGSAALSLAYVAAGRVDLFVFTGIAGAWDIAAGVLLAQEGGATVTDHLGGPISITGPGIVAGSPQAHAEFLGRVLGQPWYGAKPD